MIVRALRVLGLERSVTGLLKPSPLRLPAATGQLRVAGRPSTALSLPAGRRCYVLSGLVRFGLCGRRIQGSWNHGVAHYRCKFAAPKPLVNKIDHPKAVYVKQSAIVRELDA